MALLIAVAVLVYFILLIILILNIEDKSNIIKYNYTLFIIVLLIAMFFSNELIMDYLLSLLIRYFYYPSFAAVILTVIATMVIFIKNVYHDKLNDKRRIINYIFSCFIFIGYIIFMLQEVNVNSYNALYEGVSLLCLRYISRTFVLWGIINLCISYFSYFGKKR